MRKKPVVGALRLQRAATVHRLTGLPQDRWEARIEGGSTIREVAARLIAVDEALARGRYFLAVRSAATPDDLTRWTLLRAAKWRDRPPDELLDALVRWGARTAAITSRLPAFVGQARIRGPLGAQPLLHVPYRCVLQEWLAERDICAALGQEEAPLDPVVAEVLAVAVECALPAVVLPRVQRTVGVLRMVVEVGDETRRVVGVDFARKQYGPRITAPPDAVIRLDAGTLALVSAGRLAWSEAGEQRIRLEGDESLAQVFLAALEQPG